MKELNWPLAVYFWPVERILPFWTRVGCDKQRLDEEGSAKVSETYSSRATLVGEGDGVRLSLHARKDGEDDSDGRDEVE